MIETIIEVIVAVLIGLGAFLSLVATFGVIRLPDIYTRNHAISKSTTLGIMLILIGTFLYFWLIDHHFNSRLLIAVFFIFVTSPVSGHLIARAAYHSGVKLWEKSKHDDIKEHKSSAEEM
ncbi:multisubunit sodium/proton antiporter MrpG subunit [Bacillus oleivorans]|uniref:Multisubunit sodium/proton antiporter MrpG subunit n=1 Tax=Bacillus oleivorans TaxID=1448271 RepID=A0A285D5Z1_9BACI|nr:monovalent cation/H(+) antiporter subunit G [Bacillus oleivorans]SNX75237.1 multisubunit sodium/proton antiporter MrpG subunit [Bacillus oleivorans]